MLAESLQKFPRRTLSIGGHGSQVGLHSNPTELTTNDVGVNITSPTNSRNNIVMTSPHASTPPNLSGSINAMPQLPTSLDALPVLHQKSLSSLQVTLPNNLISDEVNTSNSLVPNSLLSLQQPSFSSLRHRRSSMIVGGQSSPTSKFSPMAQQGTLSSPVTLPHQSSGQSPQQVNNMNEGSNVGHVRIQEMALPPQLKSGGSTHQVLGGTSVVKTNSGLNGTVAFGPGHATAKADGIVNSTLNDVLAYIMFFSRLYDRFHINTKPPWNQQYSS